VIQLADSEHARALANNDPSVMSDTATAAYYRQLVQINQQMAAQGVTTIQRTLSPAAPGGESELTAGVPIEPGRTYGFHRHDAVHRLQGLRGGV
jgi:hypothetical protein